jgi:hypothetical protein
MREAVHYVPIVTTVVALVFAVVLGRRYRERGGTHLAWWCFGMVAYGAGTITESLTTLFGWSEPVFKAWYFTGALLGGAPLAQGTAYLLLSRRTATRLALAVGAVVLVASVAVVLAPIRFELVEPHRLSGRVFGWPWVRRFSPFLGRRVVETMPELGRRSQQVGMEAMQEFLPRLMEAVMEDALKETEAEEDGEDAAPRAKAPARPPRKP